MDVLVAGGGPAGLACAAELASRGLQTKLIERRSYPVDKACGEGVQPPGIAALERLGAMAHIESEQMARFKGIRYAAGGAVVEGEFSEGPGYGIRRLALSQALRQCALNAGVEIVQGDVRKLLPAYDEFIQQHKAGKGPVLVGADGIHSFVRQWAGLAGPLDAPWNRFGVRRHFRVAASLLPDFVEVYPGRLCEAYVTPCGPDTMQIALLWHSEKFKDQSPHNVFDLLLQEFPQLSRYAGQPVDEARGAGRLWQNVRVPAAPGVFLIGDAAGYMDAITGEGISLALEEAHAAADVICSGGGPAEYARRWKTITRNYRLTTRCLLWMSARPNAARTAVRFLSRHPQLFRRLLSVNMGTRSVFALLPALFE